MVSLSDCLLDGCLPVCYFAVQRRQKKQQETAIFHQVYQRPEGCRDACNTWEEISPATLLPWSGWSRHRWRMLCLTEEGFKYRRTNLNFRKQNQTIPMTSFEKEKIITLISWQRYGPLRKTNFEALKSWQFMVSLSDCLLDGCLPVCYSVVQYRH